MDPAKALSWQPPTDWRSIDVIDSHAAGEPFRVLMRGMPELEGDTVVARRRFAMEHHDDLRKALMWEPRGHADMYGGWLLDPVGPESDLSVLFLHNEGFSTMCGHGVIALTTVAVETGLVEGGQAQTEIGIDTPAGKVVSRPEFESGRVRRVEFENVVSFVDSLDNVADVDGVGEVRYDLAFGGAYYAYVDASTLGIEWPPKSQTEMIAKAASIKAAVVGSKAIGHPTEPDMGFLYGIIFTGPPSSPANHYRNVCVFADGEVDRSPTGTGVSGRLAIDHALGLIKVGETMTIESIIGTTFSGRVERTENIGSIQGVVPVIGGSAHITGRNTIWVDPSDPLSGGFLLR